MNVTILAKRSGVSEKALSFIQRKTTMNRSEFMQLLSDVSKFGAHGGIPGFSYYWECNEFIRRHRTELTKQGIALSRTDQFQRQNAVYELIEHIARFI